MRSVVFLLIFFFAASFGDVNFDSKVRNFSMELLYHAVQESDEDVMISPYVIWYLLISMAYETMGVTREQVSKVFLLTEDRSELVAQCMKHRTSVLGNMKFVSFLFYDVHLNVYLDSIKRLENDFGFKTQRLDFEEPQRAYDSAMKKMETLPSNLLLRTEDFVDSSVIMSNSFIFIEFWSKPFKKTDTVRDYYRDDNETTTIDMMYMKAPLRFFNFESLHASVTELPFRGDKYCMLLVRPHRGYDVHQVFRELRRVPLKEILAKLQSDADEFGLREIEVRLPQYGPVSRIILNKPLINMGFLDAFDLNLANFKNFVDDDNIFIGEFAQSAHIIFSHFMTMMYTSTPGVEPRRPTKKIIAVKDPLIFFIMEKSTATMLFGGSLSKIALGARNEKFKINRS